MLGYIATALGLYNLTRLDLHTSFQHAMLWRMLQVVGLPFIFIPISTLNYVGVPREKSNQISSFSNFARNLGGSVGTALLTTFLARSGQVYQQGLARNVTPGNRVYRDYIATTSAGLMRLGQGASAASSIAYGRAYRQMVRQASMLSYKNAFFILSMTILCLAPLPFVMRKPPKAVKAPLDTGH
jgi:DHA2 family multidrug resistance protein